jgi:cellulose synthase/poly-beta-1,6-N-acetylglucosamine synthase-like glycosyltransferase
MTSDSFIFWAFIVLLGYFLGLLGNYVAMAFIGFSEGRRRARQHQAEDYSFMEASRFTIPVSIVLPVRNEEKWVAQSLGSILKLDYPEYEVIVVDDESTDRTFDILDELLELEHVNRPYLDRFASGKIRGLHRSKRHPNVTVLQKESGLKKAGAVNAALNLARYKYICVMDGDTILEPDAFLKVMVHIQKNPEKVVGVGSYFGLVNGFKLDNGTILEHRFSLDPVTAYQNLEYVRAFLGGRIAWSKFNAMPCVAGGFGVWRRDVLLELGGFVPDFSSEDLEMTFHAHDYIVRHKKKGYEILMLPYHVGWTEGPATAKSLITQRDRWQRVKNETVARYRHMILNPKHGSFGMITLPYFLLYEVFGVFFEMASIGITLWGLLTGVLHVPLFLGLILFMILAQAGVSLLSMVTLVRGQRVFGPKYVAYFVLLSFLELFWYRWLIGLGKITGTVKYLLGIRSFDQYERETAVTT